MARTPKPTRGPGLRCAIYTRKSTEEGLDQAFNSLDAQREACAAYVLSQRHEGWQLLPDQYDDGGFSGGTLERPGLKRLLAEVEAGRIDVIIIYKVDRLTRSLADFAKIVEILDAKSASFVSVTQAFNTTTSMGRLTLNVLLSFAQFEREVTGERIRDKIAASKKKGLWMGGPVPLGYEVRDRKLVVAPEEAALVRHIFQRYIALPSVKALVEELGRDGHRTKIQTRVSGPHRGGCPFRRGTLYHLLSNRIYLGDIVHKGDAHPGEHPAIVPQPLWDAVQARRAARGPGQLGTRDPEVRSRLAGLLFDGLGRRMTPNHSRKGSRRYRRYVTREPSEEAPAWSVNAHDVEQLVEDRLRALLRDRDKISRIAVVLDPLKVESVARCAGKLAERPALLSDLPGLGVQRIDLFEDRLEIRIGEQALLSACGLISTDDARSFTIDTPVERIRRGHEIRLVIPGPEPASIQQRDPKLIALVAEAIAIRDAVLARPDQAFSVIATALGKCRKRMAQLMPLAWLAPDIVEAIVTGTQPADLTHRRLLNIRIPIRWDDQRRVLGFG